MSDAVCTQIRAVYAQLTRCERRVADVVLANPAAALETPTAKLAAAAQVSQPQVIRFCRATGFDGVKGLKRALAGSLASGDDAPAHHPLLARSTQALGHVDRATFAQAARLLAGARQVEVLADAAHAPLLDLALHALWRLGLPARPELPGDAPRVPLAVCLALGASAALPAGVPTVWITERAALPPTLALPLVTGAEAELAPALLATLALQLLLADVAVSLGPKKRGPGAPSYAAGTRPPTPGPARGAHIG